MGDVFSAHAEVVPMLTIPKLFGASILRARGGSSYTEVLGVPQYEYSPRTRR